MDQFEAVRLKKFSHLAYLDFYLLPLFIWVILRQFLPMRDTKEFKIKKDVLIKIGDRILIDDEEWKVAEIINNTVTLYREGVGGMSHTIQMPVEEAKSLLPEHA